MFYQLLVVKMGSPLVAALFTLHASPATTSSFLAFKFTVSGQPKSSVGSQRGCESGVKLKKHTHWARRWGMTTGSEGGNQAGTLYSRTRAEKHTCVKSVSWYTCARAFNGRVGSSDGVSSTLQHFVLSLCSRRRWGVCYVKFYVPAIWH